MADAEDIQPLVCDNGTGMVKVHSLFLKHVAVSFSCCRSTHVLNNYKYCIGGFSFALRLVIPDRFEL